MSVKLQQTEIGQFPSTWEVNRIDSAFDIQQGKQVSKRNRDGEHQRPFLRTKNVFWNRLELTDLDQMHFSESEQSRLKLHANDLLVCEGGSIGRTALWNNEVAGCLHQNHLHRLRSKGDKVHPQFGMYWLWYAFDVAKLYFGRGNVTTIPNLSQSKLAELPMAFPPLSEQKKIAHILSAVQRAIEAQERIIQTTTELFKTMLHQLMTAQIRLQKKSKENRNVNWEEKTIPIADLNHFETLNGLWKGKKEPFVESGVIRNTNFTPSGVIDYSKVAYLNVEKKQLSKRRLEPGDIIIERSGGGPKQPVGRVVYFDREDGMFSFSNFTSAIRVKDKSAFDPRFVFYCLMELYQSGQTEDIQRRTTGIRNLDFTTYKERAKFPRIPLPEQKKIAKILSTIQQKADNAQVKTAKLQTMFRTLLHELMTAKIRVSSNL